MRKNYFYMLFSILVLTGTSGFVFVVQRVEASNTIYIRNDGSIDPPDGRILTIDNMTYFFSGNINDSIIAERRGITIDGLNHRLTGVNTGDGLCLRNTSDVTIRNLLIKSFRNGLVVEQSSNITITKNEITECKYGVSLVSATCSRISENNATGNTYHGIVLYPTSNLNVISANILTLNGEDGITILSSQQNHLVGNNITKNGNGIRLGNSSRISIEDNTIVASLATGFASSFSKSNTFSRNNVDKNTAGIVLESSSDHEISDNNITSNYLNGAFLDFSSNNTIVYNTVMNNKGQAGILLDHSNENSIMENRLLSNRKGIYVKNGASNLLARNSIEKNSHGIYTEDYTVVQNNSIVENDIMNNSCGVRLGFGTENNRIVCNNFAGNGEQASLAKNASSNCWNDEYPRGGNHYSDYSGTDNMNGSFQNETGNDGIGDIPYIIDANNTDRYPLMGMFYAYAATINCSVETICNSTILDFSFNGEAISFSITPSEGTDVFCRICLPTALISEPYHLLFDDKEVPYNLLTVSNETFSYIYFNLTDSAGEVVIVPESLSSLALPILIMTTLLAVTLTRARTNSNISLRTREFS